jgi:TRAP-type mannitol/chloroaromatic compound transport system permease small subunit
VFLRLIRRVADVLSGLCLVGSILSLVGLVTVLLYEVVARYGFNAPTIWSYDVASFLTGTVLMLACGWCQRNDGNIRVDALVARMSPRLRARIEAIVFTALILPALGAIDIAALSRAYNSFISGEVDAISPWGPRVWPFYCAIALGLSALWLQCLVTLIDLIVRALKAPLDSIPEPSDEGRSWKLSG